MASHDITSSYRTNLYAVTTLLDNQGAPTITDYNGFVSTVGKRDKKTASSNGLWPYKKGVANCTNPYFRFVANHNSVLSLGDYLWIGPIGPRYQTIRNGNFLVPFSDYIAAGQSLNVLSEATATAVIGILNKYQARVQSFQAGVSIGELGETLRQIRNPAKALRASITPYRKRQRRWVNGRQTQQTKNAIADTYLEWVFGVQPLISDVNSAMEALARLHEQPIVETLSFSVPYESFKPVALNQTCYRAISDGFNDVKVDIFAKQKGGVRIKGGFLVDVKGNTGRLVGLDLDSFTPTAWNLLPYSFLVDYFSNVGDVLSARSVANCRASWLSQSQYLKTEMRAGVTYVSPRLQVSRRSFSGPTGVCLQRSIPSLSTSFSDARIEIPSFDDDAQKWLNIAALAESQRADLAFFNSSRR